MTAPGRVSRTRWRALLHRITLTRGERSDRELTLRDERSGPDASRLWARLDSEGALHIDGRDAGPGAALISAGGEYEWFQTIRAEHLPQLVQILGGESGSDVMSILAERFTGAASYELQRVLREGRIPIEFSDWSGSA